MTSVESIYHVGAHSDVERVSGLSSTAYCLAQYQAEAGHDVRLVLHASPSPKTLEWSARHRVRLVFAWDLKADLRSVGRTPIGHLHGSYRPSHLLAIWELARAGACLVITGHGSVVPEAIGRSWLSRIKKVPYLAIVEQIRFRKAQALIASTPREAESFEPFRRSGQIVEVIPIPAPRLRPTPGAKKCGEIVFLGRFDIEQKGLDRLADLARACPEVDFHLYGLPSEAGAERFAAFGAKLSSNVTVHAPVSGEEKQGVLSRARLLVLPSLWEPFGIVLIEALLCGTPCLVSPGAFLADTIREAGVGFVLPHDPRDDPAYLRAILREEDILARAAARAPEFARTRYDPAVIAEDHIRLYRQARSSKSAPH